MSSGSFHPLWPHTLAARTGYTHSGPRQMSSGSFHPLWPHTLAARTVLESPVISRATVTAATHFGNTHGPTLARTKPTSVRVIAGVADVRYVKRCASEGVV